MKTLTVSHRNRRYWPAKLVLSHPLWCPAAGQETPFAAAITYGEARATLYGSPRPLPRRKPIPARAFHELSGKRRVYRQRLRVSPADCFLGWSQDDPTGITEPFKVRGGEPDH